MEKRILIAFSLSILVLMTWNTIFPPPKNSPPYKAQYIDNKEVAKESNDSVTSSIKPTDIDVSYKVEEIKILENDKIHVEFSNIGGQIKSITIKQYNINLPVTNIYGVSDKENLTYNLNSISKSKIIYEFTNGNEKIIKTYELKDNNYYIQANVHSEHLSNLSIDAFKVDTNNLDSKIMHSADRSLYEYSIAFLNKIIRKGNAVEFNNNESKSNEGEVIFTGYRDRYFCLVIRPKFKTASANILPNNKRILLIKILPKNNINDLTADIYIGPQNLNILSSYNHGFENIMVFSNWWILDIFAKLIYFFIHFLQSLITSWGLSIIILAFTIYGITYPLTFKSMASMKKMQALQPKMKDLQEKHKNDPQRLNKEVMDLYKENGVNPLGGCLPMILQMPIFYGLYQVLWRSVDFKGKGFLWIKDLSMPDQLITFNFILPLIGNELNILPIFMAIIMFFQQKYTSRNMVITDENQLMQQKMMSVMMPLGMGFIFYHFASGLCIYFTIFYLMSTLTQRKMSKLNVK